MNSSERVVLVTGSTRGIGRATAELFAASRYRVVVHGIRSEECDETLRAIRGAGGHAGVATADLTQEGAAEHLIDTAHAVYGRLDVLVNNAGANVFTGTLGTSIAQWQHAMDLDLRAVWLCSKAAARSLERPGAIVNVASNHAFSTMAGSFPYNVAKAGVVALGQSLALELTPERIRVNTVCPGYIDTPINETYFGGFADPARERARVEALHPVRRIGMPQDVARAIRFLADEQEAGFITGTSLLVDGGRSALMQDPDPEQAATRP
ncbi:SDR family NAD(P)-dependent oxidoreductase [Streptomyces sp. NBC_01306]|uniref:SDR family NAD(P)-dependent oxidoreductase n=1 Tax=Streptomyces sp. NBC_01306 TaxID=2903819 RepID=UPI002252FA43|nr:SDR family oxidoreductase [Streptomyces sp. NBC_01306]MCX4723676.1 SDR family oxidoreductase [Streptomyces sp. NBC_01306]